MSYYPMGSRINTADHVVIVWPEDGLSKPRQILHGDGCPIGRCDFEDHNGFSDDLIDLDPGIHYVGGEYYVGGWAGSEPVEHDQTFYVYASLPLPKDIAPPESRLRRG